MDLLTFQNILTLIIFIVPGYLTIYFISIYTDYLKEEKNFERIIQYILFSSFSYGTSFLLIILFSILSNLFINFPVDNINYLQSNPLFLSFLAIIVSPIIGVVLGKYYFLKGFPHKHFNTRKHNSPSIYSKYLTRDFQKGAWIIFHMKNGNLIMGKFSEWDLDEEKRDYVISVTNAKEFLEDGAKSKNLPGEKVIINTKDCFFIEIRS